MQLYVVQRVLSIEEMEMKLKTREEDTGIHKVAGACLTRLLAMLAGFHVTMVSFYLEGRYEAKVIYDGSRL